MLTGASRNHQDTIKNRRNLISFNIRAPCWQTAAAEML
jgi:hypothetical protein